MAGQQRTRAIVVLAVFAVLFPTLTAASFTRMSATFDEPLHLTMGYLALKADDYRVDPEHPPFLRMWAALPLLVQRNIDLPNMKIDSADPIMWIVSTKQDEWDYSHSFLYEMNDADHMLYPARFMISLLGVLLGFLIFFWAREWLGFWPAVIALAFYTFEPNILAHASLVTTDFGITCFLFGGVYFLWRTTRCLNAKNLAGLVAFSALAAVSKFSAVVLGPVLLVILAIRALQPAPWPCKIGKLPEIRTRLGRATTGAGILLLVAFTCWAAIWAVYGFRYLPSSSSAWKYSFDRSPAARDKAPLVTRVVHWTDENRLLPNAFSQGILLQQIKSHGREAFLDGAINKTGWWYYFPVAFLIKTPIPLVVFFLGGLIFCAVKWKDFFGNALFVLVPLCLYLGVAMSSGLDIGLRHILPIYPFVILLAALCAAEFMRAKRRLVVGVLGLLCVFWLFEFARVYPHNLAFFNSFIGGPQNGYKYLTDSNIDWGQDLKGLKRWMDQQGVKQVNLAYFGVADPSYYGIQCTYIPGGTFYSGLRKQLSPPQLPGYVVVSDTVLDGTDLPELGRIFYKPILEREPNAVIGYSIRIYWVNDRWW